MSFVRKIMSSVRKTPDGHCRVTIGVKIVIFSHQAQAYKLRPTNGYLYKATENTVYKRCPIFKKVYI